MRMIEAENIFDGGQWSCLVGGIHLRPLTFVKKSCRLYFKSFHKGPHLFKITPSKTLAKGEYIFLLLGSAEPPKGSYGKVYDFSIQGPGK